MTTLRLDLASDLPGILPGVHLVVVHEPPRWTSADWSLFNRIAEKLAVDLADLKAAGD